MRVGDLVRLIPEMEGEESSQPLWDDPPEFTNIYFKNHTGRISYDDVGTVLEQKELLDGVHSSLSSSFWVKLLCSSGVGWVPRYNLELVR